MEDARDLFPRIGWTDQLAYRAKRVLGMAPTEPPVQAGPCFVDAAIPYYSNNPVAKSTIYILPQDSPHGYTGVLLNNLDEDGTPYVLTAKHIGLSHAWVGKTVWECRGPGKDFTFYFDHKNQIINDPETSRDPNPDYQVTGATIAACGGPYGAVEGVNDFVLLRLPDAAREIIQELGMSYAGWSHQLPKIYEPSLIYGYGQGWPLHVCHGKGQVKRWFDYIRTPRMVYGRAVVGHSGSPCTDSSGLVRGIARTGATCNYRTFCTIVDLKLNWEVRGPGNPATLKSILARDTDTTELPAL